MKEGSQWKYFCGNFISNSYFLGNLDEPVVLHIFLLGAFFQQVVLKKYGSPRFPWKYVLEIRLPHEYSHWELFSNSFIPGN
jgi:hypothetical protein